MFRYPGSGDFTVALVGSHMDVVPAVPEEWERDPFKLSKFMKGSVCVLV
jgi:acetylornithine deacetylase